MDKHLHIVTHEIPWPVKHGGLVDLYFKIKSLHDEGLKIHLHCYYKNSFEHHAELENLCQEVYYYRRKKIPKPGLPFIASSRSSQKLYGRLLKDNHPILLEGIHCTAALLDKRFSNRKIIVRLHNIEHIYYRNLYQIEKGIRKIYFEREARLLIGYEKSIASKAKFLAVSEKDCRYYKEQFNADCEFLPVFIPWEKVTSQTGSGSFCLYHGNLSVNENSEMALRLAGLLKSNILKIAGLDPSNQLIQQTTALGVQLIKDPSDPELQNLISNAHINILPSLNSTGVKLKLLNALFNGRHCIANEQAVQGSGLEKLCIISEDGSLKETVMEWMNIPFTDEMIAKRKSKLLELYNNKATARRLISYLY